MFLVTAAPGSRVRVLSYTVSVQRCTGSQAARTSIAIQQALYLLQCLTNILVDLPTSAPMSPAD